MNLDEINSLIKVREYVVISLNNGSIDRATVSELNGMLILIDRKIIDLLKSQEFKEYIGYRDVRKAIEEVAKITNIKSGMRRE